MKIKTLIHTAFVAEARLIINELKLVCKERIPYNIYIDKDKDIVLIISGIGEENTKKALKYAQEFFTPETFINFGIAGCVDKNIEIGSLFCTNVKNLEIKFATISSHKDIVTNRANIKTTLVDMESETFLQNTPKDAKKYVFKVVSDHLNNEVLPKDKINSLIQKSLKEWIKYAR
ncbi:MAG: nucleoside phosphorylase [Campylobacteraceae bacterium]|jgi:nucleoside phosphorylase|nr:nucleoside phosphorylase [Campylobacteraceae bacterium]